MPLAMNADSGLSPARLTPSANLALTLLKWLRRLAALLIAAFWSMFFIEHMREWYSHPDRGFPPAWVGGMMVAHFAMILGLLVMLRWERLGSLIATLGTLSFLAIFAFARHTMHLPYIVLTSLIPVGIVMLEYALALAFTRRSGT